MNKSRLICRHDLRVMSDEKINKLLTFAQSGITWEPEPQSEQNPFSRTGRFTHPTESEESLNLKADDMIEACNPKSPDCREQS